MVMGATRFFRVLLSLRLPQHQKELVVASTSRTFDVGIVGAGPSGATAAIKLAAQGHDVALIDAATFPRKALCVGWLSAQAKPLLDDIGVSVKKFAGRALESVTFYNADLSKSAQPSFAEPPGILLDRTRFDQALVTAAAKAGATFLDGCRVTDVVLEEDSVSLVTADTDPIRSRLLIVASGRGTPLLARLKLGAESTPSVSWIAQVDAEVRGHKGAAALAVVLGIDTAAGFGVVIRTEDHVSVEIQTSGDKEAVLPSLLKLCRMLADAKLLDTDLSDKAATVDVVESPGAVALAMDSHVAKHTLVVGDAGGFVSAASGEGIYPAMWSASIAADVMTEALATANPQDTLRAFDSRWRGPLADYLRAPNTDMQYLVPLIFTHQPMADRMGAAFFSGENI